MSEWQDMAEAILDAESKSGEMLFDIQILDRAAGEAPAGTVG
jgi:hypothetical protein